VLTQRIRLLARAAPVRSLTLAVPAHVPHVPRVRAHQARDSLWLRCAFGTVVVMEPPPLYITTLFALGTMLGLLLLLRLGQRMLGASVHADLTQGNSARRMLQVGQVLGVFLIASSSVKGGVRFAGGVHGVLPDVLRVGVSSVIALALMMVTGHLGIGALLRARLPAELSRGNVAAGVAAGAHYVAVAVITSRSVSGDLHTGLHELGISLTFFVLGQLTLLVFITLFRALTTYDDAEQIQGENLAAALSYAGVSIAIAIIIARALEGDFVSWGESLKGYGGVLLLILGLYPVRQILVQVVLLGAPFTFRGGRLDAGVAAERNEGMGALEAVAYLATAFAVAELA
jgi:uncharacterized membrane protein YjfL (UPF0719 family)